MAIAARVDGISWRTVGRIRSSGAERAVVPRTRLLEGVDQVVDQMEPVGDLDRARRPGSGTLGVGLSTIATHDLHAQMRPEPRRERGCLPTRRCSRSTTIVP